MKDISRRQLLAVGVLGRTATMAGCLGRRAERASTGPDGADEGDTDGRKPRTESSADDSARGVDPSSDVQSGPQTTSDRQ